MFHFLHAVTSSRIRTFGICLLSAAIVVLSLQLYDMHILSSRKVEFLQVEIGDRYVDPDLGVTWCSGRYGSTECFLIENKPRAPRTGQQMKLSGRYILLEPIEFPQRRLPSSVARLCTEMDPDNDEWVIRLALRLGNPVPAVSVIACEWDVLLNSSNGVFPLVTDVWKQRSRTAVNALSIAAISASIVAISLIATLIIQRTTRWLQLLICSRSGRCLSCGYQVQNLPRCPECGSMNLVTVDRESREHGSNGQAPVPTNEPVRKA